jgi:hypothetical protein
MVLSNSGALVDQSNSVQVSMFDLNARSRRGGYSGINILLDNVTTIEVGVLSKSSIHASQGCRGEWTAMIVHSEKGANTTIFHSRLYYFPLTLTRVQDKYSFPSPGSVEPWTVMTWDEQDQPLSQRHTLTESRPMHRTHEEPTLRSRY